MFRRCPKAFHNNYNRINHIGVIYSQYPFGGTPTLEFRAEGVSERILAINDTYMINTVVIVVKHFGASFKHSLLKFYCSFKTCRYHPL